MHVAQMLSLREKTLDDMRPASPHLLYSCAAATVQVAYMLNMVICCWQGLAGVMMLTTVPHQRDSSPFHSLMWIAS